MNQLTLIDPNPIKTFNKLSIQIHFEPNIALTELPDLSYSVNQFPINSLALLTHEDPALFIDLTQFITLPFSLKA